MLPVAGDILESFDNHPPLILPSHTFHLELGKPVVDSGLFRQLQKMQEFLRNLPVTDPTISQVRLDGIIRPPFPEGRSVRHAS